MFKYIFLKGPQTKANVGNVMENFPDEVRIMLKGMAKILQGFYVLYHGCILSTKQLLFNKNML